MKLKNITFILFASVLLASCEDGNKSESMSSPEKKMVKRETNPQKYTNGQKLFAQNCAACHGKNAEGDKNWRSLNDKGKYPPPPLDGTGHAWHHSTKVLVNTIQNGTEKIGGSMPAWKDLSGKDIEAILVYIQAQWSDEIYAAWYNNHYNDN